jgi:hypothetical protein
MKVQIKNRFGEVAAEFERKEKVWTGQRRGESFMTALVRCYYPAEYRRIQKRYGKAVTA